MGFLSKQYESSGAGISKKAPKKKGFKLFGEIFIRKFWKLIEANMLYSIFFIPLVLAWICFVSNIFSTNAALISGSICRAEKPGRKTENGRAHGKGQYRQQGFDHTVEAAGKGRRGQTGPGSYARSRRSRSDRNKNHKDF